MLPPTTSVTLGTEAHATAAICALPIIVQHGMASSVAAAARHDCPYQFSKLLDNTALFSIDRGVDTQRVRVSLL